MRVEDLVKLSPSQIRYDQDKMLLFIDFYREAFSVIPKCTSCSFSDTFKKLKDYVNQKNNPMSDNKKYQVKRAFKNDILTYRKDNKPYRSYGNKATDDFLESYLTEGTKEQLEERKNKVEFLGGEPKEVVLIQGKEYSADEAKEYLKSIGKGTRATKVESIQEHVDSLSAEDFE